MSKGKSFLYGFFVGGVVAGAAALITAQARNGNVLKKPDAICISLKTYLET